MKILLPLLAVATLSACDSSLAAQPDARPDTILSGPVIPGTSPDGQDDDDAIIDVDPAFEDTM